MKFYNYKQVFSIYQQGRGLSHRAEGGSAERYHAAGLDAACAVCHGAACHLLCGA